MPRRDGGSSSADAETGLSSYELERLTNIKNNQDILRSLGLAVGASGDATPAAPSKSELPPPPKRRRIILDDGDESLEFRRSARVRDAEKPQYNETAMWHEINGKIPRRPHRSNNGDLPSDESTDETTTDGEEEEEEEEEEDGADTTSKVPDEFDDDDDEEEMKGYPRPRPRKLAVVKPISSVKDALAQEKLLDTHSFPDMKPVFNGSIKTTDAHLLDEYFLGKSILPLGGQVKGAVMALAAGTASVRYNKYSGIQEWRNAIFLFVNLGGPDYENLFEDEGRFIRWFAQPLQRLNTPVIQRLMSKSCPVLLFCRPLKQPYLCLGRVEYQAHDDTNFPIGFDLRLVDHKKLLASREFVELIKQEEEEEEEQMEDRVLDESDLIANDLGILKTELPFNLGT